MAKLKIFVGNNDAQDNNAPSKAGYIRVVEQLKNQANFDNFLAADPEERADLLHEYLQNVTDDGGGAPINLKVFHQKKLDSVDNKTSEPITSQNCQIVVEFDKKKIKKKSKHTMSFPNAQVPNTAYLTKYVRAIVELYNNGPAGAGPGVQAASDFLYGIMLLTRCR